MDNKAEQARFSTRTAQSFPRSDIDNGLEVWSGCLGAHEDPNVASTMKGQGRLICGETSANNVALFLGLGGRAGM